MRILVVSDIHGNLEGLEACLAAAKSAGGYDRVFNLGDIVGYGANPNEVVARSRELGGVYVRGNHDKACSGITDAEDFNHIAALAAFCASADCSFTTGAAFDISGGRATY